MILYRNKKTGKKYALLAFGLDCTNSRNGLTVAVYSPEDNPHQIFVRELQEFDEKFEAADAEIKP